MGLSLPSVPAPQNGIMPVWVKDYCDAVRLLANATVAYQSQPPYGGSAFSFAGSNAVLTLKMNLIPTMDPNQLFTGTVTTGKISGSSGSLTVVNGVITSAQNAT